MKCNGVETSHNELWRGSAGADAGPEGEFISLTFCWVCMTAVEIFSDKFVVFVLEMFEITTKYICQYTRGEISKLFISKKHLGI